MNLSLGSLESSYLISYLAGSLMPVLASAELAPKDDVRVERKSDGSFVSDFDKRVEEMILDYIVMRFPGLDVVSEEIAHVWPPTSSEFCIIDPVDGTHNFLMGAPVFGSMIAFVRDGQVIFSAIITSREICFAGRGAGAFMIKRHCSKSNPIMVSAQTKLKESLILFEGDRKKVAPVIWGLNFHIGRFRYGFSSAVSQILVASGGLHPNGVDGVVSLGNKPWDHLTGCLLVEEAGGKATDRYGRPYSIANCCDIIFSNGKIHDQLLETINL